MSTKLKPNQFLLDGNVITEHPILFQTEMVKANLEGRKTQTRRTRGFTNENPDDWTICHVGDAVVDNKLPKVFGVITQHKTHLAKVCFTKSPYGKPGDLLWVKETFCMWSKGTDAYQHKAGFEGIWQIGNWKPSIHMPKAASRIWVMIEEIKVERLQDISEVEAKAEGVKFGEGLVKGSILFYDYESKHFNLTNAKSSFKSLWKSINGEDSWRSNPWVWVVKYRILSKTGRPSMEVISDHYKQIASPPVADRNDERKEASHA